MNSNDQADFAHSRLLPPFGRIVRFLVHVLQLNDLATYGSGAGNMDGNTDLEKALEVLNNRTADNVFSGLIVKEDSKQRISMALAQSLRVLPSVPFSSLPTDCLAAAVRDIWAAHESAAGRLSAFYENPDSVRRAVLRHATLEIAIRAGAMACFCGDKNCAAEIPIWANDCKLKQHLRNLLKLAFGTRDQAAEKLNHAPGEIDRWLDDLDVPGESDIRTWERLLVASSDCEKAGARPLWRLYAGRRIWKSVSSIIPEDLRDDLLKAYSRIRNRVNAYLALECRGTGDERQRYLALFVMTGRIMDPLLLAQSLAGETDAIWRRHIEAFRHADGVAIDKVLSICETYANAAAAMQEGARHFGVQASVGLDDLVRRYLQIAESNQSPLGKVACLVEEAMRHESDGNNSKVAACMEELVQIAPTAARWHSLGRIRLKMGRHDEAEKCYREALVLAPALLEARADLALLLANTKRSELALAELAKCSTEDMSKPEWKFVRGKALLLLGRDNEAQTELLECLHAKFKVGVCYKWLAEACDKLGQRENAREYRKRAAELECL